MRTIASSIAAFCLLAAGPALATDTEAPRVLSIAIAPASVDVSSASAPVHITIRVTDDESGMQYGNVFLYNPAGNFVVSGFFTANERISGTKLDGIYEFDVQIPRFVAPATWRVDALMIDFLDHQRNIGGEGNEPYLPGLNPTFTVVNTGAIDTTAPTLGVHGVSRDQIFTGDGPVDVEFIFKTTDQPSGFTFAYLFVNDPNNVSANNLVVPITSVHRISGDDGNGEYRVTLPFPQNSATGTWEMNLYLADHAGNTQYLPAGHVVVSAIADDTPPIGKAVEAVQLPWVTGPWCWHYQTTVSHDGIDAAASPPIFDSGESVLETTVTGPGELSFQWRVDSQLASDYLSVQVDSDLPTAISGNTGWAGLALDIPAGPHTVRWRYYKDSVGSAGADRGWIDEVRFLAESDTEAPLLQDLRISPRTIHTEDGGQQVTVTLEISDEFNGFEEGRLDLVMPSGNTHSSTNFGSAERISGDEYFGTYKFTVEIPDNEELGTWRAALSLSDYVDHNERLYGPGHENFPTPGQEQILVTDGTGDVQAPFIEDVAVVNPNPPDVGPAAGTVTVKLHITDDLSGFSDGNVSVYTPDGNWTGSTYFDEGARISGTRFDGMYEIVVPVPHYGPPGTWRVGCWLIDRRQNRQEYPYDLDFPHPEDAEFQVTNSDQVDLLPPSVTLLSITPASVNATTAATQVTVDLTISDDLSGLRNAYLFIFRPGDYDNNVDYVDLNTPGNQISGNAVNGTYQAHVPIPQGSYAGNWLVRVYIVDMTGRSHYYGPDAEPYPSPATGFFTVIGTPRPVFLSFTDLYHLHGTDALLDADPDHDGLNNATELVLGGNPADPLVNGSGPFQILRDANSLHLEFTLTPSLTATPNGTSLNLTDGSGGAPFRLTGQTQNGLANPWTNVLPIHQTGQTYRVSLPLSSGPGGFIRLQFEDP